MSSEHSPTPISTDSALPQPALPILIIDDDLAVLDLLRAVLKEEGFPVIAANNAGAALIVLEGTEVSLIVTDFMMPGFSGLELADLLRRDSRTAAIPIILMSAFPPADVGTRVAAVIGKPFGLDALLGLVRQFWPQE